MSITIKANTGTHIVSAYFYQAKGCILSWLYTSDYCPGQLVIGGRDLTLPYSTYTNMTVIFLLNFVIITDSYW